MRVLDILAGSFMHQKLPAGQSAGAAVEPVRQACAADGLLSGVLVVCRRPCHHLLCHPLWVQVGTVAAAMGSGQPELLLLDVVDLSLPADGASAAAAANEGEDGFGDAGAGGAPASIELLPDASAPELLYAVHTSAAYAISLPWLPLLAGLADEGEGGARLPAALPQPGVELLVRSSKGVVAAAPVGDALSGSSLVVLEADGKPQCLRPHRAAPRGADGAAGAAGVPAAGPGPAAAAAAQREVDAQLATIYGDLRKG